MNTKEKKTNDYRIKAELSERLDKFLSVNIPELTRSAATALIESGGCTVNGIVTASKKLIVKIGDEVVLNVPEPEPAVFLPENIPLNICHEDDSLIVVNKPKGMVVHPASGIYTGTLVNVLMFHCGGSLSGINGVIRPGIVHRIDKDTSGLLVAAKNDAAHLSLAEQLKEHTMTREYEAVVHGRLKAETGTVNAPIGRSVSDRKKMCVTTKNAREAVTHYEVIGWYDSFTHLRLRLETGRTHQIRVHMAYIGHPVAGDFVYGNRKACKLSELFGLDSQCLHARKLGFVHPKSGEYVEYNSELPEYFLKVLEVLNEIQ